MSVAAICSLKAHATTRLSIAHHKTTPKDADPADNALTMVMGVTKTALTKKKKSAATQHAQYFSSKTGRTVVVHATPPLISAAKTKATLLMETLNAQMIIWSSVASFAELQKVRYFTVGPKAARGEFAFLVESKSAAERLLQYFEHGGKEPTLVHSRFLFIGDPTHNIKELSNQKYGKALRK